MAELITVPTFIFKQGDPFSCDEFSENVEEAIHVDFYHDCIVLRQNGNYKEEEQIKINPKYLKALFKEINKHLPDAELLLKSRK